MRSFADSVATVPQPEPAPLVPQPRAARRDAARNRRRVLDAAARLFVERGVEAVRMDDIAAAAGVGKPTLYRGFGDRSGLVAAVLDERERELQDAVLRGAPPLGPDAPPRERLIAFLDALVDLVEGELELLLVSENSTVGARYRIGSYAAWRLHVSVLLRQARPELDADWHADALLAPLAADLYRHQRRELGVTPERVKAGLTALVTALA
jgi:AcrR family transcriptional regulator